MHLPPARKAHIDRLLLEREAAFAALAQIEQKIHALAQAEFPLPPPAVVPPSMLPPRKKPKAKRPAADPAALPPLPPRCSEFQVAFRIGDAPQQSIVVARALLQSVLQHLPPQLQILDIQPWDTQANCAAER